MNLYAWKYENTVVFTLSSAPSVGDYIYKYDGIMYQDEELELNYWNSRKVHNTIYEVDSENNTISLRTNDGLTHTFVLNRSASDDILTISKLKHNGITYKFKDAEARQDILNKQDTLVSGTNIKTINNQSILGSGNIDIQGGTDLPDQTGQAGKFLTTNGTNASWAEVQGSSATITYFDSSNWTLDVTNTILSTGLSLGNNVNVFKNGNLLRPGATNDYTISNNDITFTDSLLSTDSIAVINGNMNPMQSVGYNTFSNESILATDWVVDNTYLGYNYKCDISCTGVTSTMYAQVTFAPEEAMSGNYANICDTGTGVVTIYSKVAEAITIPMIMVLGV